jgi:hypothetical protein
MPRAVFDKRSVPSQPLAMKTLSGTFLAAMVMALDLTSPVRAQTVAAASTAVREQSRQVAGLGSYVPLRFSRAAVERDAEDHIRLTPVRQ